jgi:hypothetical protein
MVLTAPTPEVSGILRLSPAEKLDSRLSQSMIERGRREGDSFFVAGLP